MPSIQITKEEFCLFNKQSRMGLLEMHGELIIYKLINGKIKLYLYEMHDFWIEVVKGHPEEQLISIQPVKNLKDLFRYLCLD